MADMFITRSSAMIFAVKVQCNKRAALRPPEGFQLPGLFFADGVVSLADMPVVVALPHMPVMAMMAAPPHVLDGGLGCHRGANAGGSAGCHRIGTGRQNAGREQRCDGGSSYEQLTHVNLRKV
jgi:hypothetical protein